MNETMIEKGFTQLINIASKENQLIYQKTRANIILNYRGFIWAHRKNHFTQEPFLKNTAQKHVEHQACCGGLDRLQRRDFVGFFAEQESVVFL